MFCITMELLETPDEKEAFFDMESQPFVPYDQFVEEIYGDKDDWANQMLTGCSKILVLHDTLTPESSILLSDLCKHYFESEFLPKIAPLSRPLDQKYGDVIERHPGRFEINPPKSVVDSLWLVLRQCPVFEKANRLIRDEIQNFDADNCIEEIGILPVEPHTPPGYWHRDVFSRHESDFQKKPFYYTQLIYLDNKANTEFCVHSSRCRNNNYTKYDRKIVAALPRSSVVFDGRFLHRGLANTSDETRYALYISYYVSSYQDREHALGNLLS